MQDEEILRRLRQGGDPQLFGLLVDRHREPVMRLVLALLGPRLAADAEDVAQEVFVRAYQRLAGFRGECAFPTWLYRIAWNLARDHLRRAARRPLAALPAPAGEEPQVDPPDPGESSAERLARVERARVVRGCLEDLPHPYRTALHLFYWLEAPVDEIAALMGVPAGTVKSYLSRGRTRLDQALRRRGVDR